MYCPLVANLKMRWSIIFLLETDQVMSRVFEKECCKELPAQLNLGNSLMKPECVGRCVGHQSFVVRRDRIGRKREEGKEIVECESNGEESSQPEAELNLVFNHVRLKRVEPFGLGG